MSSFYMLSRFNGYITEPIGIATSSKRIERLKSILTERGIHHLVIQEVPWINTDMHPAFKMGLAKENDDEQSISLKEA